MVLIGAIIWLVLHNKHLSSENEHLEARVEYWKALASQFIDEPNEEEPWKD